MGYRSAWSDFFFLPFLFVLSLPPPPSLIRNSRCRQCRLPPVRRLLRVSQRSAGTAGRNVTTAASAPSAPSSRCPATSEESLSHLVLTCAEDAPSIAVMDQRNV